MKLKSKNSDIQLYNGDCLELLKSIPDNSVDLVIVDPPYEIQTSGGGLYTRGDLEYVKELKHMSNGFDESILDEYCRVLKKINIYIFCSKKQVPDLLNYFIAKKCNYDILTWHKTNPVPACGNKYLSDTEFILFFREKGVRIYGQFSSKLTYYLSPLNQKDKAKYEGFPTCKPAELISNYIINSSQHGDTVLDSFMGSGTTGECCKKLNRKFIGIEIDPDTFDLAERRIRGDFDEVKKESTTE